MPEIHELMFARSVEPSVNVTIAQHSQGLDCADFLHFAQLNYAMSKCREMLNEDTQIHLRP